MRVDRVEHAQREGANRCLRPDVPTTLAFIVRATMASQAAVSRSLLLAMCQ
jgi:hypothetical protein